MSMFDFFRKIMNSANPKNDQPPQKHWLITVAAADVIPENADPSSEWQDFHFTEAENYHGPLGMIGHSENEGDENEWVQFVFLAESADEALVMAIKRLRSKDFIK